VRTRTPSFPRTLAMLLLATFVASLPAYAQSSTTPPATPAPTQTSLTLNVGAGALGLGGSTNATPSTDISLSLNPGIAKMPWFSLRSDNVLAPGAYLQMYAGGGDVQLPKLSKTGLLSQVRFDLNATFGIDRIVPPTGVSQSHFGMMAGASMHYLTATGVDVNLFQVGFMRSPGAPWGANAPYFGGSVSYLFGKQ
jgi:hypothetical protein